MSGYDDLIRGIVATTRRKSWHIADLVVPFDYYKMYNETESRKTNQGRGVKNLGLAF